MRACRLKVRIAGSGASSMLIMGRLAMELHGLAFGFFEEASLEVERLYKIIHEAAIKLQDHP
jgi:hypothetical protein